MNTSDAKLLDTHLEEIEIFTCYTNTDLTEGRGWTYPYAWSDSESTAMRLAADQGVMGCDASVRKTKAFRVNGEILGPVRLETPTNKDVAADEKLAASRAVIEKARAAGLSNEEIELMLGART